jgi:hypothetical protein
MSSVSFTNEEIRVLKALTEEAFDGTDPTTLKDLVLRGFVTDPAEGAAKITFTGRVALKDWEKSQPS